MVATSVMLDFPVPLVAAIACANFRPVDSSCAQFFVDANDGALPLVLVVVVVVVVPLLLVVVAEVVVVVLP